MRFTILPFLTSIVASRDIKEFVYEKDFEYAGFDTCGAPPCVEYRWNSEIDNLLWLQRIEMTGISNFNLSDGEPGAIIKSMDVSWWKLKPESDFDAKLTLKDLETGEHIFISTTGSRGAIDSRHFESSTTISRDGTENTYTFQISSQYEDPAGLVILISISETHDTTTSDAADDVTDDCQICRNTIKSCRESSLCQGLTTCLEEIVGLDASLENLDQLRPGSYFNITAATIKCQYAAHTYADFLKAMDCVVTCGSNSRVQTQILPGKMELVFTEETFDSRFKLKMGEGVCDQVVGMVKRTSATAVSVNLDEAIKECLNVGAVSSFYKIHGDFTTVTVHISDYIGPMPLLESISEIQPFSISLASPQLLMKN